MNNTLDLIAGLVDSDDHNSTSCQIARALKGAIDRGKILPGTRLPSARALAERLGVSRSTAHRSFQTLTSQGYIKSAIGKASQVQKPFLKSCMSTVVAEDDSIDCSPSIAAVENPAAGVDHFDSIDTPILNRLRLVISEHCRSNLSGATVKKEDVLLGNPSLRQSMSDYLLRARLVRSTKHDIAVVSGPSTRIELLIALLVNPGYQVAVPEDSSERLIRSLNFQGADTLIVGCDRDGMRVDLLPFNEKAPALVYITPSRGAVLSMERRKQLSDWVRATGSLIVEDDCDSFRTSGTECLPAVHSFQTDGRVLYLPAPPTILSPLLKVCCAVLPAPLMQAFLRLKQYADPNPSSLEQIMLSDILESGHFESMMAKSRSRKPFPIEGNLDFESSGKLFADFEPTGEQVVPNLGSGIEIGSLCR
jgi:GntR family transcriptional regulator / MocR family aminotransferase